MNLPTGLPLTPEDWEKTPPSVQTLVIMLWEENQILKEQVKRLQIQAGALQDEVKTLKERVNKNPQNSSKPPSSDPPQTPKYHKAELSGEKKGGRKGHHGHGRKLKPPDQVSQIVKSVPSICKDCGAALNGEDKHPERHR